MVVFTGDLQNRAPREIDPFRKLLSSIKAKDGIFSVMGNHDFPLYMEGDPIMKSDTLCVRENVDEELGWRLLVNDRQFIKRGEEKIYISGMDNDGDGVRFPQNGDIQHALYGLTPKHFVVMLEHDPSAWRRKILPHSHVQLTLSGHTHGGQFSFLGWSPASLKYKEYSGLYSLAGRYLYVSNGLSGVVPFRFGTLPEISVFTLRTSKSSVNK
jgi:predicted MPP superfamily phosphohydrolase